MDLMIYAKGPSAPREIQYKTGVVWGGLEIVVMGLQVRVPNLRTAVVEGVGKGIKCHVKHFW